MSDRPDWAIEGRDWPNRAASRFVTVDDLRWHVQVSGDGPVVLLLHGAGAATHSWRGLIPLLAEQFMVVAPDLPGHGFTGMPPGHGLSLPAMARRTAALMAALGLRPALVVGHSAGAAIGLQMVLDGRCGDAPVVAINGALQPFAGAVAPLFQGLAMGLFVNPVAVRMFAAAARDRSRVARMIRGTGSSIDDTGIDLYARLLRKPGHIAGTLGMMGSWDLRTLRRTLPHLKGGLTLVVGDRDSAVPPSVAAEVGKSLPAARIVTLPGLGHLAHEERPDLVAGVIRDAGLAVRTSSTPA
ncbi:MAG: alpha/beta fold hydrolase [Caulobacteraceae bacterium]|nr:alpha/beta fold hydrolase [Caulobacteraceae bacterium]